MFICTVDNTVFCSGYGQSDISMLEVFNRQQSQNIDELTHVDTLKGS
jgi:hypothetical protein